MDILKKNEWWEIIWYYTCSKAHVALPLTSNMVTSINKGNGLVTTTIIKILQCISQMTNSRPSPLPHFSPPSTVRIFSILNPHERTPLTPPLLVPLLGVYPPWPPHERKKEKIAPKIEEIYYSKGVKTGWLPANNAQWLISRMYK